MLARDIVLEVLKMAYGFRRGAYRPYRPRYGYKKKRYGYRRRY